MEYTLLKNNLSNDLENDFYAKHVNSIKMNREQLVKDITVSGSILKKTETHAVIEAYWDRIISYLSEGKEYRDDNISVTLNVSGVFLNEEERFDPKFHEVSVSIAACKKIKSAIREIRPHYVSPDYDRPFIHSLFDWKTKSTNQSVTPEGVVEVYGTGLKIHDNLDCEGIFFINKDSGDETKVDYIKTNEPKTISMTVPELTTGTYKLEFRNTPRDGRRIRVGQSEFFYTVS